MFVFSRQFINSFVLEKLLFLTSGHKIHLSNVCHLHLYSRYMKICSVCSEGAEGPKCVSASVSTHLILSMLRGKTTKTLQL